MIVEAVTLWATAFLILLSMKTMIGLWIVTLIPLMGCGSDGQAANNPLVDNIIEVSPADLQFAAAGEEKR